MVTMPLLCKLENAVTAKILGQSFWILACEPMPVIAIHLPNMSEIYLTILELGLDNISGNWTSKSCPDMHHHLTDLGQTYVRQLAISAI